MAPNDEAAGWGFASDTRAAWRMVLRRGGTSAAGCCCVSLARPIALPRPQATPADDPLRAILLVLAASVLFSISDATAKRVSETLSPVEVAWIRYLVFVLLALLPAVRGGRAVLYTRRPVLQAVRGVGVAASAVLFIFGLRVLPMADNAAINFVSPLFIAALSVPLLGERVDKARWVAIVVGLLGAVIAAQPGTDAFRFVCLLPALSAATWAVGMVITRLMGNAERPTTTLAWTAASGLVMLSCLLPFAARLPDGREFALCLVIGVVASAGQWLVVLGYRLAPASLLAPFSYLQLIWSTLLGWLVFGAHPATAVIVGALMIAGSGLYSAHRERARW
jgi:drug/metabolite transporter (DMT)-like permease